MFEVRFRGKGGQGAVMAAQVFAEAAVIEGNYAVAFSFFGAERRGAPVLAFTSIDAKNAAIFISEQSCRRNVLPATTREVFTI
jgi:2-oxoacid:acceptor oxidoreductase gamma subunit (pyruvate/2-ketoisovalerate family)